MAIGYSCVSLKAACKSSKAPIKSPSLAFRRPLKCLTSELVVYLQDLSFVKLYSGIGKIAGTATGRKHRASALRRCRVLGLRVLT